MTDYQVLYETFYGKKPQTSDKPGQVKKNDESDLAQAISGFNKAYNKAESIVLYLLGYKTVAGVQTRQLDMYSGLTGYHIRTVPGRRWNNPVLVGSGAGFLAIVDRAMGFDVIRITDQYCGLSEDDFDPDTGIVKDSINLETIQDLGKATLPTGCFVQGLTILPKGMLIANITTPDSKPTFLKFDVPSLIDGITQPDFNGITTLEEPFGTSGKLIGSPARFDMAVGNGMYYFLALVEDSLGERGIAVINFRDGKVPGFIGLSNLYTPIAIAHGSGMIHVLVKDSFSSEAFGTKVLRLPMNQGNYLMTGGIENGESIPEPQNRAVTHTYASADGPVSVDGNNDLLAQNLNMAKQVNTKDDLTLMGTDTSPEAVDSRSIDSNYPTTSKSIRIHSVENQELTAYQSDLTLPITVVELPINVKFYKIDGYANALIESGYELDSDGSIDPTKSFFRVFHASHYDFLSDGGWSYGCDSDLVTNGITPIDSSIDNLVYKGSLKDLPDLAPILIDYLTGNILYRFPKPVMLATYSGEFATMKLAEGNRVIRTSCSDTLDTIATGLDGIDRPDKVAVRGEDGNAVYAFLHTTALEPNSDYDEGSNLFNRAVLPVTQYALMQLYYDSWDKGTPEWIANDLISPVTHTKDITVFQKRGVPSDVFFPTIDVISSGGYYFLNLIKVKSNLYDELTQDTQEIDDQIAILQAQEQTPEIETQIADLQAQKATIEQEILAIDPESNNDLWVIPRSVLKKVYQIEPRTAQNIDPVTGIPYVDSISYDYSGSDRLESCWSVVPVNSLHESTVVETKNAGIIIDPGIRSWVNLYIQVGIDPYDGDEGISYYANDEYKNTSLGKKVGSNDQMHHPENSDVFGKYPGYTYEAGWKAISAIAKWKVGIVCYDESGIPVPHIEVETEQEITDTAPQEIMSALADTFNIKKTYTEGGWYKGYVLNSFKKITRVEVEIVLSNHAFEVYKWGWRTIQVDHATLATCPGPDPGYFAGHNCEGAACGNVECTQYIFGSGNYALYPNETRKPETVQRVLRAFTNITLNADPFAQNGYAIGTYIVGSVNVKLNDVMAAYRIDIGQDQR